MRTPHHEHHEEHGQHERERTRQDREVRPQRHSGVSRQLRICPVKRRPRFDALRETGLEALATM